MGMILFDEHLMRIQAPLIFILALLLASSRDVTGQYRGQDAHSESAASLEKHIRIIMKGPTRPGNQGTAFKRKSP